ncbi:MAG TPA: hypothetical protein VKV80_07010 [Streptosporangiaceae bacterium]|nr:hypothetical protein [Streptosporangiaceae bacterium]
MAERTAAEWRAAELLTEVRRTREMARAVARSWWFPMVVFGGIALAAAAIDASGSGLAIALWWPLAAAAGFAAVWRYYRMRSRRLGVGVSRYWQPGLWVVAMPAAVAGGEAAPAWLAPAIPYAAVAGCFLLLAWRCRSWELLVAAAALLTASALAVASTEPGVLADAGCGLVLVCAGLWSRARVILP